jgi:autotransporter strand-loop-strand O-heptosyltransferase
MNNIQLSFVSGPKVEITGDRQSAYRVRFIDSDSGLLIYETKLGANRWCAANLKYYINWNVKVEEDGIEIIDHKFDVSGKKVYIQITSSALGDTLAWIPYLEEFKRMRNCEVCAVTHWNDMLAPAYPNLKFLPLSVGFADPGQYHAAYYIGSFDNDYSKNKNNWRHIPLQQVASDLLGLKYQGIKPRVKRSDKPRPIPDKYVTISENSTFQGKLWNCPNGWQELVDWLNARGLKVISVDPKPSALNNIIKMNGRSIEESIAVMQYAEFNISVASGSAWLAWALDVKPVIISGFTEPYSEMTDCIRIINEQVCHGCYNDQHVQFDRGNWRWCPRNNNFDCSTKITPDMVKQAIAPLIPTPEAQLPADERLRWGGLVINTRDGKERDFDMHPVRTILMGDEYGLGEIPLNDPKIIVDIGGHIGTFGLKAKSLWPNARLIAYEPNKTSAELYTRNMQDNNFKDWEVICAGISYDKGKNCLVEDDLASGGGILIRPEELGLDGRLVGNRVSGNSKYLLTHLDIKTFTLEEILDGIDYADILKIDCEGAEIEMLERMKPETAKKIGRIVGEYHYTKGYNGFVDLFKSKFPDHYIKQIVQPDDGLHMSLHQVGEFTASPYINGTSDLGGCSPITGRNGYYKILIILHHCSTGGMPQYVLRSVEHLKTAGHKVEVVEFNHISDEFQVQRTKLQELAPFHTLNGEKVKALHRIVNEFLPDVIHVQEFPEIWAHSPEAIEAMKELYRPGHPYKIVETSHGNILEPEEKRYFPDAFAFVCEFHARKFAPLNIPYTVVEYVSERRIRPNREKALQDMGLDPEKTHILNVGLFTPGKNQGEAFEIARRLPQIQFHFVGNQAENFADYWKPLMANKPNNCVIWGERANVDQFYGSMDLLLFTSKAELNPLVLKEAAAWGMPILMRSLPVYLGAYDNNPLVKYITDNIEETCDLLRPCHTMAEALSKVYG